MSVKVQNTMSGKLEEFVPVSKGHVGMYVCGINTYDDSHMGHAKAAVTFDVIRRHLEKRGFKVKYVVNFTDVEDHCIQRAQELGITIHDLAKKYIAEYFKDMGELGVRKADVYPIASEHIKEIIEFIQKLIKKGFAYESDGDVYFSVEKFKDFGKLSHRKLDEMIAGARIEPGEKKRHPMDFALWKAKKPNEPYWPSPWGEGRPGWHIECSAMSLKYLGETFDIHGGGTELIFPHHENELMQSEALTGKPFVKYWLHGGLMNVGDQKMSKSLNNFFTIKDVLKEYNPLVVRFFLLNTHYRKPIDFNKGAMQEASQALARLQNTLDSAVQALGSAKKELDDGFEKTASEYVKKFLEAMDEDFNSREAIARIFEFSKAANKYLEKKELARKSVEAIISAFREFDSSLTIFRFEGDASYMDEELIAPIMNMLIELREKARKQKNFELADEIRDRLKDLGIKVEDTAEGVKWKKTN